MKDIDLNNLDLSSLGSWPMPVKAALIAIVSIVVLVLGYFLDTQKQLTELESSRTKEISLKKDFEAKQAKAVQLDAYKKQMEEMKQSFGAMLRQLPSKTEGKICWWIFPRQVCRVALSFSCSSQRRNARSNFMLNCPSR